MYVCIYMYTYIYIYIYIYTYIHLYTFLRDIGREQKIPDNAESGRPGQCYIMIMLVDS